MQFIGRGIARLPYRLSVPSLFSTGVSFRGLGKFFIRHESMLSGYDVSSVSSSLDDKLGQSFLWNVRQLASTKLIRV